MIGRSAPLTLGTAGHIDHGKTSLVEALTGVNTDRLPEERARGMSIELGYAPLVLPSGRRISVVDVPGHERFVRTMVAGATGIDFFLMTIAADDGVKPQTREHLAVLAALSVRRGVVAITKTDRVDAARASAEAAELLPDTEIVACSAKTGEGVVDVADALARVASELPTRVDDEREPVLHIDRTFTLQGQGTIVTGTLWSGSIQRGDTLLLLPTQRRTRVRSVQIHDEAVEQASAGQRVALNLAGIAIGDVSRGDALVGSAGHVTSSLVLDAALDLAPDRMRNGLRVQVHHGTRHACARLIALDGRYWQVRLDRPLLAATGDRLVVRSITPPDTLGGGSVIDPHARRHGRRPEIIARLERLERGQPDPAADEPQAHAREPTASATTLDPTGFRVAARLRAAAHEPPTISELGADAAELPTLRAAGLAVRIGRDMYAHPEALAAVQERLVTIVQTEGSITLARLRDDLATSRKYAQALLEHFDATRVTRRLADDRRVLRRT